MSDYIISPRADRDIEHFYQEGVERYGLQRADKFLDRLYDAFSTLAMHQGMGTSLIKGGEPFRRWIVRPYPYAIFYSQEGDNIRIARIFDARSNYIQTLTPDDLRAS